MMAELPSQDTASGPVQPATPRSVFAPSPLTPTGTRPRPGPRRQSRFTEEAMTERTPVASVSERSMDYCWYGQSAEYINASTDNTLNFAETNTAATTRQPETSVNRRIWLRFLNGSLHPIPCLVLLGILGYAMRVLRGDLESHMGVQAIVAMIFLSVDVLLDVMILFRAQKPWPTWGLVLRFACGIAYITLFLIYVGLGSAFPDGYTYWGLRVGSAAPAVYILLCVEGMWNLIHLPVCRYQLGSSVLARIAPGTSAPSTTPDNRTSFNQRFSVAGTEHSSISLTWRRWVRTRSTQYSREDLENSLRRPDTREPSVDFTLREQPSEEEDEQPHSSRPAGSPEDKAEESGTKVEKWREGRSGNAGQ